MSTCESDISSSFEFERNATLLLCETIDSPRSLTVSMLLAAGELGQLMDLECDPVHYEEPGNFADDYLCTELLKKSQSLPLGVDRRAVALQSFYDSEATCRAVNERLCSSEVKPNWFYDLQRSLLKTLQYSPKGDSVLHRSDFELISESLRFGPGATTSVAGYGSVPSDKYDEEIHLTPSLYPFVRSLMGQTWWDYNRNLHCVEGNRFTTVPKSAKTDRGICIEPSLNIFVQLGIAKLLRQRLKRLHIDLTVQEKVNQRLAQRAWAEGLVTIDLSRASDSLAWSVILKLFPPEWVELLLLARSPATLIDGKYVELEKFSSMGNGYTFELETLLFRSVVGLFVKYEDLSKVSVYGDDIVIPAYAAKEVIDALNFLGFSVNQRKSYLAGSFYESCGTDWFKGVNVRPFYLRGSSTDLVPYSLHTVNSLRIYAWRRNNKVGCDGRFRHAWESLRASVPAPWRSCNVPPELGDVGIIADFSERGGAATRHSSWDGWTCHICLTPSKQRKRSSLGYYVYMLSRRLSENPSYGFMPVRGYLGKVKTKKAFVKHWPESLFWVS